MKMKTIILLFTIVITSLTLLFNSFVFAEGKTLKNYYCNKCGTHIEAVNQPMIGNCQAGGGHSWRCLGEVGDRNYQCSKCGLVVKSKDTPYGGVPCKNGGGHNWKRIS